MTLWMFPHQDFRRDGNDLHMTQRIGLVEALCGFQIAVTHLDGRQLAVKYPPGKVIEPGTRPSSGHINETSISPYAWY